MPHYIFIFYFPLYRRKRWLCRSEILLQGCSRPYLVSARGQFLHNFLYGEVVGSRICWAKTCNSGRQRKVYWHKRNNQLNDHSSERHFVDRVTSHLSSDTQTCLISGTGWKEEKEQKGGGVVHLCRGTSYRLRGLKIPRKTGRKVSVRRMIKYMEEEEMHLAVRVAFNWRPLSLQGWESVFMTQLWLKRNSNRKLLVCFLWKWS